MTADTLALRPTLTGVRLELRVLPRAPRNLIDGVREGRLVVRVTAPPVDGAANAAVIALLSRTLELPKRVIRLVAGDTARNKSVEIDGIAVDDLRRRLGGRPPNVTGRD